MGRKLVFLLFMVSVLSSFVSFGWCADRGPINSGETRTDISLSAPSYLDTWTFEGTAGGRVIINAVTISGDLDTEIVLYPPSGPAEVRSECGIFCIGCPYTCKDQIDWQLVQTGSYTIVIQDNGADNSGTYNLCFLQIPGTVNSPGDKDGGIIISGQTLSGTMNVASDMDAFQFWGGAGQRVIMNAVTTSGNLDTEIVLYPPSGPAEVRSECGIFCVGCPYTCKDRIDWQLAQTGLYSFVIQDNGLNDSGTYNISFLKVPGPINSPGDPDGGAIASGQSSNGTINVQSDYDAFQFYGAAGDRVIISAVTTSGDLDTEIVLYPPSGPAEVRSECGIFCIGCPYTCEDQIDWELQNTGLYTIVIQDKGLNDSGTFNISMTKIPTILRPGLYNPHPANGATVANLNDSFSWDPVAGATGYDVLLLDYIAIFPAVTICSNVSEPSCPFPSLEKGKVYYWVVLAHLNVGDIMGPVWWFYTAIPYLGDINADGVVDISDVILVLRCSLGLPIDPYQCTPCGDINNSGVLDISDVILTLRMALGLDPLQACSE